MYETKEETGEMQIEVHEQVPIVFDNFTDGDDGELNDLDMEEELDGSAVDSQEQNLGTVVVAEEVNDIIDEKDIDGDNSSNEDDEDLLDVSEQEETELSLAQPTEGEIAETGDEIEFVNEAEENFIEEETRDESEEEIEVISDEESTDNNITDTVGKPEESNSNGPQLAEEGKGENIRNDKNNKNATDNGKEADELDEYHDETEELLDGKVHEHAETDQIPKYAENIPANVEVVEVEDEVNELESDVEKDENQEKEEDSFSDEEKDNMPPIIVTIANTEFLLIQSNDENVSHLVALYYDLDILDLSLEAFFNKLRANEDLEEIHHFQESEEIILETPELGALKITEDNIYSRDITILDLVTTFKHLQRCSKDAPCPSYISMKIKFQPRFITRFNRLSELIRSGKGFSHVDGEFKEVMKRALDDNDFPVVKRIKRGI
ncbi:hypothetical protein CLIB1423_09S02278 [[Candida] railenensis]|uniref:Uncharacterized protein n=1 Tax=[Candida] railenensis TaxID=45579 RepID=A0A9P0VXZ0_9ASCO|nr:hypothetical protein CLIB1423_09S02278 [[Candida] railenensis]